MTILEKIAVCSLSANALYIIAEKWKIINFYTYKRRKWMPLWCTFCFMSWVGICYFGIILKEQDTSMRIAKSLFNGLAVGFLSVALKKLFYNEDDKYSEKN